MKMTLLELTQSVLSAMDSDEISSIDDTAESMQVATVVKECYFDIIGSRDWPFMKTLTTLTGLGDTSNPTKMQMPDGMHKAIWIRYNKKAVTYMTPSAFKEMIDERDTDSDTVDANGYRTDQDPTYWTTYDDTYIIFDSYDSDTDSTLQTSKSSVFGVVVPTWTHEDDFTPTLPDKMFPMLLAEAKSTAFFNQKQMRNEREEMKARKGQTRFQREAWRAEDGENDPTSNVNYGRR